MLTICHAPSASPEETALIVRAQDGDQEATMALVSQHIRRLRSLARRWAWAADIEDLTLAALEGFLVAIRLHAADGRPLWALARGRALECVRTTALSEVGILDVPHTTARRVEAYVAAVKAGEEAESPEDVSPETLHAALVAMLGTASYSADPAILDVLTGAGDTVSTSVVVRDLVERAMAAQPSERDREVLRLAYGFMGQPLNDGEVGQLLGVSRAMAQRLRSKAIERARVALNVSVAGVA